MNFPNSRRKKHREAMVNATTYQTWREAALELDYIEGNMEWKDTFASDRYNYELIYERLTALKSSFEKRDYDALLRHLREGQHHDLGNMGNASLYTRCHVGTKHLIEEYIGQVCLVLQHLRETEIPQLPLREKYDFFKDMALSYGKPALLLSGGATLGLFHLGVIKALWERGLLPQVIAGSSVGSIIAAMLGTHTDDEMPEMLQPHRHNLKGWRFMGLLHGLRGGGFMDIKELERCLRINIGEYSFLEAFQRTGRSINISVSPTAQHQKERLLSGYTSPYLFIWSAALASSAVPIIFPPVKLMKKDQFGNAVPYMPNLRWVDGSVVSDLPIERLMHLYDVNFSIVSQTNPHIVPFLNHLSPDGGKTKLTSIPMRVIRAEMEFHGKGVFNYLRRNLSSTLLRQASGQMYTIMAQKYFGDVTIAPRYTLWHYSQLLRNPEPDVVKRLTLEGERATWPKISMIATHAKISQMLEKSIVELKGQVRALPVGLKLVENAS